MNLQHDTNICTNTRLHAQVQTVCGLRFREVEGEIDAKLKLGGVLSTSYWALKAHKTWNRQHSSAKHNAEPFNVCLPFDFSTLRGKIINKASLFKLKNSFKTCKTVMHNPGNQKIYYIHALTGTGDYGTTDRQVCGFPNIFQSAEFITCGHPWSCRKIWQMIGGNRMYLSVV